jgi:hypothetical protein
MTFFLCVALRMLHFLALKRSCNFFSQSCRQFKSFCKDSQSLMDLTGLYITQPSANSHTVASVFLARSLMNNKKRIGPISRSPVGLLTELRPNSSNHFRQPLSVFFHSKMMKSSYLHYHQCRSDGVLPTDACGQLCRKPSQSQESVHQPGHIYPQLIQCRDKSARVECCKISSF